MMRNFQESKILSQYTISWNRTALNDLRIYHAVFVNGPTADFYYTHDNIQVLRKEIGFALELHYDSPVRFTLFLENVAKNRLQKNGDCFSLDYGEKNMDGDEVKFGKKRAFSGLPTELP